MKDRYRVKDSDIYKIKDYTIKYRNEYDTYLDTHGKSSVKFKEWLIKKIISLEKEIKRLQKLSDKTQPKKHKKPEKTESDKYPFKVLQLDEKNNVFGIYPTTVIAQRVTKICRTGISACINEKRIKAGGFFWKKVKTGCMKSYDIKICEKCPQYLGNSKCKLFKI